MAEDTQSETCKERVMDGHNYALGPLKVAISCSSNPHTT